MAPSARGHLIAIRTLEGTLRTIEWDADSGVWGAWEDLPTAGSPSDPWVQPALPWSTHGLVNNVFSVVKQEGASARTYQWIHTKAGTETTIGIGESDSLWFRPASARLEQNGSQALFGVFRDSTLRMRVWDSLARQWGPWSQMGIKTAYPPTATQVNANNVNVFVTRPDGSIRQNWWEVSMWNGWVLPAASGAASEPSSVNINWYDHLLFSFSTKGLPQYRIWNGGSWTGWIPLDFPARRALSPVVVGSSRVLLYGLDTANQIVRASWSKSKGWTSPETLSLCSRDTARDDSITAPPDIPAFTIRSGWLKATGSLAAYAGPVQLIHPDGRTETLHKTSGAEAFRVPLQGVGFLRYGSETARCVGLR